MQDQGLGMDEKIKVGISTCLTGENVRYDGGHKLDHFLMSTLGRHIDYVPVCPETECSMPIPREPIHLIGNLDAPRLVTVRTKRDFTNQMETWAARRVHELVSEGLCGFIFKSKSPSCGMRRIRVHGKKGLPPKFGVGIFARIFMAHFPLLPVEEEGRLRDLNLRENFIERLFVYRRWRAVHKHMMTTKDLLHFHTIHELLILSHSTTHYRQMGKLLADLDSAPFEEKKTQYVDLLSKALKLRSTPAKHIKVLQRAMGYFKRQLSADEKAELLEVFQYYRLDQVPLIVPITLLNNHLRKLGQPYLEEQVYLKPHTIELALRNHC